jgi:hypothetical protein
VYIEDLNLDAPGDAVITVKLAAGGQQIAGAQNDIEFDAKVRVKETPDPEDPSKMVPDCTVNSAIRKADTQFGFLPPGCSGDDCKEMRAVVFSLRNTAVIPDGSVLYTCNVTVSGSGTLAVKNAHGSDPNGRQITGFAGREGNICVGGVQPPTLTPTTPPQFTATPTIPATATVTSPPPSPQFTATPTIPATATVTSPPPSTSTPTTTRPTATPSAVSRGTATPSPTFTPPVSKGKEGDGGCHVAPAGTSSLPLWLLAPLGLALLRRRARR